MAAREEKEFKALVDLARALARVLELGVSDLQPAAQDLLCKRVHGEGWRIEYRVCLTPMVVDCSVVSPARRDVVELFKFETADFEPSGNPTPH